MKTRILETKTFQYFKQATDFLNHNANDIVNDYGLFFSVKINKSFRGLWKVIIFK